jgi:hypothetical protein
MYNNNKKRKLKMCKTIRQWSRVAVGLVFFCLLHPSVLMAQTVISSGQVMSGLSGSTGNKKNYVIAVPSGASKLEIKIWGGTGDCDLYVKRGSIPTTTSYNYRPYLGGNTETVTVNNPVSGNWYIMLNAYSAYSGLSLSATYTTGGTTPVTLNNGQVVSSLSGSTGQQKQYKLSVPSGQSSLEIKIWGGSGDCDLYVKRGSQASTSSYDYRPYSGGNNEPVTVANPASGDWFIMLNAYSAYSGLSLSGTYIAAPSRVATPTISPAGGTYTSPQSVSLSCGTFGATIRYTTNGSEPTSSSTQYSSWIIVSSTTTIKAKAFKSGMTESYTASATYTINAPSRVATPSFNPAGGTYSSPQSVTLSCGTFGATIRYTTNGSEPTSSSTQYSSWIIVNSTTTIKAKAFMSGMTESYTASATYTINIPSATTLYNNTSVKSISDAQGGQKYYKVTVPSGQTRLIIKIFGGSGDCDLYVKRGALPTTSSYDYRPYLGGNNETVDVPNPASGDWYIMLRGFSAYTSLTLQGCFFSKITTFAVPEDTWGQKNPNYCANNGAINQLLCWSPVSGGGSCYGISTMELRWFKTRQTYAFLPRLRAIYDTAPSGIQQYTAGLAQNLTVVQNYITMQITGLENGTVQAGGVCNLIKSEIAAGRPALIVQLGKSGTADVGHAVVAIGYSETDTTVDVFIADSNYPDTVMSLKYNKSSTSWSYYWNWSNFRIGCISLNSL